MPTELRPEDGWISSEQLKIPRQELADSEIEGYLTWQFSDLAKKPDPMMLRETASVVRFLRWLGIQGVPKKVIDGGAEAIRQYQLAKRSDQELIARQHAERTAQIVWGDLSQFGQFEPCSKRKAQSFFRKHASDWSHPWLKAAVKFLDEFDLPPDARQPFRPKSLVGRHLSAQGDQNPYLHSDLSERIAAADHVLRRVGVKARRARIAASLNASPLTQLKNETWGPAEVGNRVRTYGRQRHHLPGDALVDKWVLSYRWALEVAANQPAIRPEPEHGSGA